MFEGLVPEPHNERILQLLFLLCHWHTFAKLRIQTDGTLDVLNEVTEKLASQLRMFVAETCPKFSTKELRREAEACRRRETREHLSKNGGPLRTGSTADHSSANTRRPKTLNLQMYKLHALGDYTTQIHLFGTTDSYSTQLVKYPTSHCSLFSVYFLI